MSMATTNVASGNVITIETGIVLDLQAFKAVLSASRFAETSDATAIDVNLAKTLHIRDSGVAMLLLLRKLTRWTCPVRLINWDPVIHHRLTTILIGTKIQIPDHWYRNVKMTA